MTRRSRFALSVVLTALTAVAALVVACGPRYPDQAFHQRWILRGQHLSVACAECHTGGALQAPTRCMDCHEDDRLSPSHYPGQDCGDCHTEDGWGGGTVDHSFFPLKDAHDLTCNRCHTHIDTDGYTGLDPACSSCHEEDRKTLDHYAGLDCGACHRPTTWDDVADFDHDVFFQLPHRGAACEECHLEAPDYASFSCIDCHEHQASTAAEHHKEVSDYRWDSDACVECHGPN